MSIVFDEVSIKGLRKAHFEQLWAYLQTCEEIGWYYGNRKQFEKRHDDLVKWVSGIVEKASKHDYVIPKK